MLDAELYGTLPTNPQQQQRQTRPPVRSTSMNPNESYMPSSYPYEPASFLSQFGSEDQLFQRPSLNNLGQNYVSNPTRTRDPSGYVPTSYTPAQQHYQPPSPRQRYPSDNQEMFFTDHHGPQTPPPPPSLPPPPPHFQYQQQQQQHHEEDSKRQGNFMDENRLKIICPFFQLFGTIFNEQITRNNVIQQNNRKAMHRGIHLTVNIPLYQHRKHRLNINIGPVSEQKLIISMIISK